MFSCAGRTTFFGGMLLGGWLAMDGLDNDQARNLSKLNILTSLCGFVFKRASLALALSNGA
jgi:hypothetical protein